MREGGRLTVFGGGGWQINSFWLWRVADQQFLVGEGGRLAEAQTEIVYEEGKAKFL